MDRLAALRVLPEEQGKDFQQLGHSSSSDKFLKSTDFAYTRILILINPPVPGETKKIKKIKQLPSSMSIELPA